MSKQNTKDRGLFIETDFGALRKNAINYISKPDLTKKIDPDIFVWTVHVYGNNINGELDFDTEQEAFEFYDEIIKKVNDKED